MAIIYIYIYIYFSFQLFQLGSKKPGTEIPCDLFSEDYCLLPPLGNSTWGNLYKVVPPQL